MKIGVISDSHDNTESLREALRALSHVEALIHCGDVCTPKTLSVLNRDVTVHVVGGNCDNHRALLEAAEGLGNVSFHGNEASLSFEEFHVYAVHRPGPARIAAHSGDYHAVFHGHTHTQRMSKGDTFLVNPGELLGRKEQRGYAVFDTERQDVSLHRLN